MSRLVCGLCGLQFLQAKLQLLKLTGKLLAFAAEDHPPVLLNDELEMFDLLRVRSQLLVLLERLVMLGNPLRQDSQKITRPLSGCVALPKALHDKTPAYLGHHNFDIRIDKSLVHDGVPANLVP